MAKEIWYPTEERIIELNALILTVIRAKKKDQIKVLSMPKLREIVAKAISYDGDIYDKAAILLTGITRQHPFSSGNRRTAFIAAKDFLTQNHTVCKIPDSPDLSRVLLGVREGFYKIEEIKEWIQYGKIREFKR